MDFHRALQLRKLVTEARRNSRDWSRCHHCNRSLLFFHPSTLTVNNACRFSETISTRGHHPSSGDISCSRVYGEALSNPRKWN
ncbi:hypothetical protein RHGRI_009508 [Rhododendron griersonianum]|uniref:Uncharacterized protein n=1 Tax=Rhododendron griersonianum TaxID=479676 RepID=A0AAV6KF18_9ERIC|nr:hypothetical protein RHGRI_009508 [Rhododendron griersonianum]